MGICQARKDLTDNDAMNMFFIAALLLASSQTPQPGLYDSLQLAVNPETGVITGSFFDQTGRGQFTCSFLLHSNGTPSADGVFRIVTWSPNPSDDQEVVNGTLRFVGSSAVLKLPPKAHGGCWNVNPDLDHGEDTTLTFENAKPWREERMVNASKAWFYNRPDESGKTAAYIVDGDVVAVIERRGDWSHVDYVGSSGKIKDGWIQSKGLSPITPPQPQTAATK
jgi:hypothetical protein